MSKVMIIAEGGVNHNGSLRIAKKIIDAAVKAGCDAVKFQTFRADRMVIPGAPMAGYQLKNTGAGMSQHEMLKRLELTDTDYGRLNEYSRRRGIEFMSTPFDESSADFLEGLGMRVFKIPSGEITNRPLIQHIAGKRKPIILSTGMAHLDEVRKAVSWIREAGKKGKAKGMITLMHCVSNYPARAEDMNLKAMHTMEEAFGLPVGLSDHTLGIEIAIAAVALGACVIEKHITLDRDMKGPDHKASLEPKEFDRMVKAIRNVERAAGDGVKKPARSEITMGRIARRSLVAVRDINAGEAIRRQDIDARRPGTGLSPEMINRVEGKLARVHIKKDSMVGWSQLR